MEFKAKITDIYLDTVLTRYERNIYGERERVAYEARVHRPVKTLEHGLRFTNFLIDSSSFLGIYIWAYWNEYIGIIALLMLAFFVYYTVTEYYFQQTLGKVITRSVVINEYGERISLGQAALRTLIRMIPIAVFSFFGEGADLGWHDEWTKTYVVSKKERDELLELLKDPKNIEIL